MSTELKIDELPLNEQERLQDIFSGKIIPPLYADAIAKRIFNPDVHADRLNFLMRNIAKDPSIEVASGAGNESFKQSLHAKSMISDIPSWLRDGRAGNVEIQKVKQDFIFTRVELYASDMLLLQYSVTEGRAKSELDYLNVKEAILIVLMVESPKAFKEFDEKCEKYIHRFTEMKADTGLSYPTKAKMIYVQLDKCLEQYRRNFSGETEDGKPDVLQLWLSMIADVNDEKVKLASEEDETLVSIRKEAFYMAQDKEVQNMLIQERYDRMDWLTYGKEKRDEGVRQQLEHDARGMYKKGLSPKDIAEIQGVPVETIEEILGLVTV